MDEIHELAGSIQKGGFRWVEDGNTILRIIDLLAAQITSLPLPLVMRQEIIITSVKNLDDQYGWDAPRMSEAQEDAFYAMMVQWRITQ